MVGIPRWHNEECTKISKSSKLVYGMLIYLRAFSADVKLFQ